MTDAHLPWRAVAFDLDGTLADSAPGICATFSTVLGEAGYPVPPAAHIATMIGLPLANMLAHHASGATDDDIERLMTRYKAIYASRVVPTSLLFPRAWSL